MFSSLIAVDYENQTEFEFITESRIASPSNIEVRKLYQEHLIFDELPLSIAIELATLGSRAIIPGHLQGALGS